jgi:imidazolonepropionase-like amidohydrolase
MEKSPGIIVFLNAKIIDGTGADPKESGMVVVEGERIKEVATGSAGMLPQNARIIDCRGYSLLPGLIDGHVHNAAVEADLSEQQRRNYASILVIGSLKIMRECLDQGFTAVRDCGGVDAGFRIAVNQGLVPGPRLSVSGCPLSMTGGHGDFRLSTEIYNPVVQPAGLASIVADGVDDCRRASREQLRRGVNFIKVMAGGGCMSPADEVDTSQYSVEELRAVVWEAQAAGTYVAAHCYSDRSILNCIEAGIRTIEHGNLMTEAAARRMKEAGAMLVPTMVTYAMISKMGPELGVPDRYVQKIREAGEKAEDALAIALRAGVTIASGSDLLGPMQAYKAMELALQAKVMGPMGAIVAATKTNAQLIRREKDLGTIEPGKLADLILVAGDPLKDIGVLQQYREKIVMVMQGGRFYKDIL